MQSIHIKISLIGDKQTGKTRFTRLLNNIDRTEYIPTLGCDVVLKDKTYNNKKYSLNIWDCAGDERYLGLGKEYLINSHYILLFTNNDTNATNCFKQWIPENINYHTINSNDLNVDEHLNRALNQLQHLQQPSSFLEHNFTNTLSVNV